MIKPFKTINKKTFLLYFQFQKRFWFIEIYHWIFLTVFKWTAQMSWYTDNIVKGTYYFTAYSIHNSRLFFWTETNNILSARSSRDPAVSFISSFTWSWWLPLFVCRAKNSSWVVSPKKIKNHTYTPSTQKPLVDLQMQTMELGNPPLMPVLQLYDFYHLPSPYHRLEWSDHQT